MWFSTQDFLGKLSKLWLYFVILLMAQEVHAIVTIDPTCDGNFRDVVRALTEALDMAGNAATRQTGLHDITTNRADWIVTLRTFNVYFGTLASPQLKFPTSRYVVPNAMHISEALISKSSFNN